MPERDIKQTVVVNVHPEKKQKKKKRKPRKRKAKKDDGLVSGTGGPGGFSPSHQTMYRPQPNYNPYGQFYSGPAANNFDAIASSINENLKTISKTNLLTAQQDEERKKQNQERMIKELEQEQAMKDQQAKFEEGGQFLYGQIKDLRKELTNKRERESKQKTLKEAEIVKPFYSPSDYDLSTDALPAEPEPEPEPEPAAAAAEEPAAEEEDEDEPEGTVKAIESPALENQSKEVTNQILDATSNSAFAFPEDDEIMMTKIYGKISVHDAIDEAWEKGTGPRSPEITALRKAVTNAINNAKSNKDAQTIARHRKLVFDRYLKTK